MNAAPAAQASPVVAVPSPAQASTTSSSSSGGIRW
jgi:hypothetical protein